jgi:hypothetical protein
LQFKNKITVQIKFLKVMKKIFVVIIAAMSLSLFTVACGDDGKKGKDNDITPPTISFSNNDTLIVDLGDKTAALSEVTATDDVDGDVTRSIKLLSETELETVGPTTLKYTVSDAANNQGTAERPAIIKSRKLAGSYEAEIAAKGNLPIKFTMTVAELETVKLSMENFHNRGIWGKIIAVPDGTGKLKIDVKGTFYDDVEGYAFQAITGQVFYKNDNGKYVIESITYILDPGDAGPTVEYSGTLNLVQ